MRNVQIILGVFILVVVGCGDDVKKRSKSGTPSNNVTNNAANNTNSGTNNTATNNLPDPANCGNATLDDLERCDPSIASGPGTCPTSCETPGATACVNSRLVGSSESCTAECVTEAVACSLESDGCCSPGCDASTDADCTNSCGDGVLEDGELCDGDCPTSCDDGNACTSDSFSGSVEACSLQCINTPRTTCANNDGCCPSGCTGQNDSDCACVPTTTCAAEGATCGTIFNGCTDVPCGGCNNGDTCVNNACAPSLTIGNACTSDTNCTGSNCIKVTDSGWAGGYCSIGCTSDAQCGAGNHCGVRDPENGNQGICVKGCTTNANCGRTGYECYDYDKDGSRECGPVGSSSAAVGSPCSTIQACSGGQSAVCILQGNDWYQGYCSRTCSSNADCGAGAHCGSAGYCFANTCSRTGYVVYDADGDAINECFSAATGTRAVGQACQATWECAGLEFGLCANETASGLPGGYCTILCGPDQGFCSGDASCVPTGGGEVCMDGCTAANQCRTGYNCADVDGTGNNVCWL